MEKILCFSLTIGAVHTFYSSLYIHNTYWVLLFTYQWLQGQGNKKLWTSTLTSISVFLIKILKKCSSDIS